MLRILVGLKCPGEKEMIGVSRKHQKRKDFIFAVFVSFFITVGLCVFILLVTLLGPEPSEEHFPEHCSRYCSLQVCIHTREGSFTNNLYGWNIDALRFLAAKNGLTYIEVNLIVYPALALFMYMLVLLVLYQRRLIELISIGRKQ